VVSTNPKGNDSTHQESTMYEKTLLGWADMDFNSHMANTAFLAMSGCCSLLNTVPR
jgi:hypothetical protein